MGGWSQQITVYLNASEADKVDSVRGDLTRTEWVRRAVAAAVSSPRRRRREMTEEQWPMLPEPMPPPEGGDLRNNRKGKFSTGQKFDLDAALRANAILKMRAETPPRPWAEITKILGYSSVTHCRSAYDRACQKYIPHEARDYMRTILQMHVDDVTTLNEIIASPGYKTDVKGALVRGPDGEWLPDEYVRTAAITEKRKHGETIRRMLGLDAPKRTEMSIIQGEQVNAGIAEAMKTLKAIEAAHHTAPPAEQLPDEDIVEGEVVLPDEDITGEPDESGVDEE